MGGIASGKPAVDGLSVRALERDSYTEYFLTARPGSGTPLSPGEFFSAVAGTIIDNGIQTIQERIFGCLDDRRELLAARESAYKAAGVEVRGAAYIEGAPIDGAPYGGLHLWGIAPRDSDDSPVADVDCPGKLRGRLWTGEDFRFLQLSLVDGSNPDGSFAEKPRDQTERMFLKAREALAAHDFSYSDVVRTWIYLPRILDWYDEFNEVRNGLYGGKDFFGKGADTPFPASTGIQGRVSDAECAMEVLALRSSGGMDASPVLETARQKKAFAYRSAFSRGMSLESDDGLTVHVSGTASIDAAGETVHKGDAEGQARQTLESVAAVLKTREAGLEDICGATLFCKDEKAHAAYEKVAREMNIPDFPMIRVLADVCRPELELEIEAVASLPGGEES